jgi:hypothetical protein
MNRRNTVSGLFLRLASAPEQDTSSLACVVYCGLVEGA